MTMVCKLAYEEQCAA